MPTLSQFQIEEFARTVAWSVDAITKFFANPETEKAYQDWYFKKYGRHEGDPQ